MAEAAESMAALQSGGCRHLWSKVCAAWQLMQSRRSQALIKIHGKVALGEKTFVALLECEGERLLIGGGAQSVNLLTRLEPRGDQVRLDAKGGETG